MSVIIRPYKRGGWEVDIRVQRADGSMQRVRKRAPVTSKSGAKRWAQARERELVQDAYRAAASAPRITVPNLRDFAPRYIDGYARANRHKPSGIEAKCSILRNHLVPVLGDLPLDKIRNEDVQRLKAHLEELKPKTVNNVLSVLSGLLKVAVEWEVIPQARCQIRLLKVMQEERAFYDDDDYERLVRGAQKADARVHLMVLLGGDAGLRLGEMIALEQSDVDQERNRVIVCRSEWNGHVSTPKSGRIRRIPMTRRLSSALRAHRHLRGPRVFYRDDGRTVSKKVIHRLMAKALRRAGFPVGDAGPVHKLRHTFCSRLAMRGAPARSIQELAGHQDLKTTQRYMHLSPQAVERSIALLERPLAGATSGHVFGDIVETAGFRIE